MSNKIEDRIKRFFIRNKEVLFSASFISRKFNIKLDLTRYYLRKLERYGVIKKYNYMVRHRNAVYVFNEEYKKRKVESIEKISADGEISISIFK